MANETLKRDANYVPVQGVLNPSGEIMNMQGSTSGDTFVQPTDQYGYTGDVTPNSEILTASKIRLVGEIFDGTTVDTNFWTTSVSTGTVTQTGTELVLTSGTADTHYARVYSRQRAIWITGTTNKFRSQLRIASSDNDLTFRAGVMWGASLPTVTDGAYFKIVGSTISVNTMNGTVETSVASGSFNGTYTAPTLTNNNVFEILYSLSRVFFLINNVIVHSATFSTTPWTGGTVNLHAYADVTNTGASAAVAYSFRMMNVARLGSEVTTPTYYHISGNAATHILKRSGGILHKIVFNNTTGTSITIYDNTAASGTVIGLITTTTGAIGEWSYDVPFNNGLTIVTTGNNLDATIMYE